jgi:hypothetical protein
MTKKQFIQQIIIRALPEIKNLSATIQYAEQLWENLNFYGYGADKAYEPRENQNYYKQLSETQRKAFDKFWDAFKLKQGRDGAAMRWLQMGELSSDQYTQIIEAAKQEAKRPLAQGQTRKFAQGWLMERRYDDFIPAPDKQKKQQNLTWIHLKNELNNLKNLYKLSPNSAIEDQIKTIEAKLAQFSKQD